MTMTKERAATLGELKKTDYASRSIQLELAENLKACLGSGKATFQGLIGYENTVIPDVERAILSGHNINLLGLRGQAKTRLARQMTELLDEWIPVVTGSEINDDPLDPISLEAKRIIAEQGDKTPIEWLHRSDRFFEKLATPDVTVADLIGDVDPIKASNLKLSYADERVIHFGMIPRAHRCIFVLTVISWFVFLFLRCCIILLPRYICICSYHVVCFLLCLTEVQASNNFHFSYFRGINFLAPIVGLFSVVFYSTWGGMLGLFSF